MKNSIRISNIISLVFGLLVITLGLLNIIKGNDPGPGITFIILSFLFFPVINRLLKDLFGISIPYYFKFILASVGMDHAGCGCDC